ncbi:hypothetical protein [Chthonomonas calidirosea]|uniref:hypothetical protein n=1 Tax=Chthonomonas calidirosea TaxID=454171 RepID=UPI0006EC735D|nr:hypothetical protein [Chthonomonas calidirosea]CEK19417.1 PMT family glycosyltransferase, 4-amino-4-deoxy-L-arabinose transferase [Chthonomonas calidirosea]
MHLTRPLQARREKILAGLLFASLLVALVNTLAAWRRTAILEAAWKRNPDELSAQWAARQIEAFGARPAAIALLLSHRNPNAIWFDYRLHYLILPRNFDLFWDVLPQNANRRFAFLITYGAAQAQPLPPGWRLVGRAQRASLSVSSSYGNLRRHEQRPPGFFSASLAACLGLVSLMVLVIGGWCALRAVSPARVMATWWGELAVAHLVGAAMLTCGCSPIAFIAQHFALWEGYVGLVSGVLLSWAGSHIFLRGRQEAAVLQRETAFPHFPQERVLSVIAWGVLGIAFCVTVWQGLALGIDWDGYSIWQLKAKAFVTQGGSLSVLHDSYHFFYAHLDYPLLVPIQTWWTCAHAGSYSELWVQGIGLLFTMDILALFADFCLRVVGRTPAVVGCALLLAMPVFSHMALSGFADIPLAAYLIAVGVGGTLTLWGERGALWITGWLLAGLVLTKNEGLAAVLAMLLAFLYSTRGRQRLKRQGLALWLSFLLLAYLPWALMKHRWQLTSDLFVPGVLQRATSQTLPHLLYILSEWIFHLLRFGPWYPAWGLLGVWIGLGLFCCGGHVRETARLLGLMGLLLLTFDSGVYLITPHDLHWHIATSMDRLLLQVVPLLLLAAFAACFGNWRYDPLS